MTERLLLNTRAGQALAVSVALLFILTVAGLIAFWPDRQGIEAGDPRLSGPSLSAEVVSVVEEQCPGPVPQICRSIEIEVDEWPHAGTKSSIALGPEALTPEFSVGDDIRVREVVLPEGAPAAIEQFTYVDRERRTPIYLLAVLFGVLIVAMARWKGFWALIGFGMSLALVVLFLVPAMLYGTATLPIALVGSLAVMFITVLLTYGIAPQSFAAIIGIAGSLALAAGLGMVAVDVAGLDGKESDIAIALATGQADVSLQGIVLAGMVLAALGVVADTAVTQASAVLALRRANPEQGFRRLYSGGFSVGRDHLVATTHTLVLVYVGASLPLLLTLEFVGISTADALNSVEIAEPIIGMLVGSIALLLSVPLTTALAALVVSKTPVEALPDRAGHVHHH